MSFSVRILRYGFLLCLLLIIGCGSKGNKFYQHQPSSPPLEVPPDLTFLDANNGFVVPEVAEVKREKIFLKNGAEVELKKDGRLRWLEIKASPNDIWEEIKDFWTANHVQVEWQNVRQGLMETEWIDNYDSEINKDRYRVRLERTDDRNVLELYITHRGMQEDVLEGEVVQGWTEKFNDPELEIEVLGNMLAYFGLSAERKTAILDQAKVKPDVALLNLESQFPNILIREPFNRSWRFVSQSIDRLGYIITQRDKKAGWIEFRVTTGLLTSDFEPGFSLTETNREILRIHLNASNEETTVTILTDDGQTDQSSQAESVLQLIHENL